MLIQETEWFKGFVRMADDGYGMGWHECNGGNLSYRIREEEAEVVKESFKNREWKDIGTNVPGLCGEFFLITGSGKFFRNISLMPEDTLGIIEVDSTGSRYRLVWGYVNGAVPTSELITHLMNHQVKKRVTEGRSRVIYHAHPSDIIALSFILPLEDEVFTRELWGIMTECPIVFPKGIGVVPWLVPGSVELGKATAKLMEKYDAAVWAHHGMFATGEDFDHTFGLMHTIEKSAGILIRQMSAGREKLSCITADQFRSLADRYGISLDERFLQ
ncbi:MAG: rhamnulose-1-phosphate aldolase [Lachnospiraceae bacterium]|nr:rhamnulose-1-phosphate aldolase [Lachnospiraceae bacterium]